MALLDKQRRKPERNTITKKRRQAHEKSSAASIKDGSLRRRIVKVLRYSFYALLTGVFMALIAVGSMWGYGFATDSPYFAVKHISISGTHMLSEEAVLDLTGIEPNKNCFSIDLNEVENRISMSPWCASVSVKRVLPDSFEIVVQEHKPAFWRIQDNELYYADIQGNILAPVVFETFQAFPLLTVGYGGETLLPQLAELFEIIKEAQVPVNKSLVSWVRVSAGKGIEWYIDNPALLISVDVDNMRTNLDRTRLVLKDLGRREVLRRIKEIIAVDGSVWVIANSEASS